MGRYTAGTDTLRMLLAAAVLAALAACGGGGDSGSTPSAPPVIVTPPQPQTVTAGGTATFSATVTGTDLSYQWLRAGSAIAGATAITYTTPATTLADNGATFSLRACSGAQALGNCVTSAAATLTVTPAAIGAAGGTVAGPNGASAVIPPGALASATDIRIAVAAAGTAPAFPPTGVTVLGEVYAFTPHGTAFAQPVTIRVPFNPAAVPAGNTPRLYRAQPGGSFAAFAGATVNGNFLEAQVSGFSFFGTGAEPPPPPPPPASISNLGSGTIQAVTGTATITLEAVGTPRPTVEWEGRVGSGAFVRLIEGTNVLGGGCQFNAFLFGPTGNDGGLSFITFSQATAACAPTVNLRVTAVNSNGRSTPATTTLTITTPTAPSITQPPLAQTVAVGGTATYTVDATGSPEPTYEWQIVGGPVLAAGPFTVGACSGSASFSNGGRTLALSGVSAGCDGRSVSVVARNAIGVSTPSAALLVVGLLPQIVQPLAAQTVAVGGTATYIVDATGSPTPTYEWQIVGGPVLAAGPFTVGACSGSASFSNGGRTLALSGVSAGCDGRSVSVVARNAIGVSAPSAALLVLGTAPQITQAPLAQTINAGGGATFTVTATGSPTLTYAWTLNGTALGTGAITIGTCSVTASTSNGGASLSLTSVSFQCNGAAIGLTVSNGISPNATASTTLTVNGSAPSITQPPLSQTITEGGGATFTTAASGNPTPAIYWRMTVPNRGSADLVNGPYNFPPLSGSGPNCSLNVTISGSNSAGCVAGVSCGTTLSITNVSLGCDGATFSTRAGNAVGASAESSASLTVNPPGVAPQFTLQPVSTSFTSGGGAMFVAVASGTPSPTYRWTIGGSVLASGTGQPLPGALAPCTGSYSYSQSNGTLTLNGLSAGCDGRSLSVRASNSTGSVDSNAVQLTLQGAAPPTNVAVTSNGPRDEGQVLTASVTATGSNLTYQWMLTFDLGASARTIPGATAASYTTPILTQGYNNAGLVVRVCSGAQPAGSGSAPNCVFTAPEATLGQTYEVGAQGACFGGPNGWCYRSPTPQGNDLMGVVVPTDSEPMIAVGYGTVLESNDFGTNWTARFPTPRLDYQGLARLPGSARLLAPVAATTGSAAVQGGLYASDDRGATWNSELLVSAPNTVNDVAFADNGQGVAVGTGIWRSTANGTGWTQVSTAAYSPPETLLRVAMRGGIVIAVSDASNILRSDDGGATWTRVYSGTGERLIDVALEPAGNQAVVVAEGRNYVLVSSNDGQTWTQRTVPTVSARAVGIDNVGSFMLIDSFTSSYFSSDSGQTWFTTSQPGPSSILRWRLAVGDGVGGEAIAVGSYGAMIRSGSGAAFYGIGGGSGQAAVITAIESSPAGNLLMVRGGQIGRSTDGGASWRGFGQPGQHVSWVSDSLAFATLTGGGAARLYRSNDGGDNWSEVGNETTDTLFGLSMINSGVGLLIGTRSGVPRVFRTTNGAFWEPIPGLPPGFTPRSVRALSSGPLADPLTTVVLVGGDNGQLLRSPNGGQSWFEANIGSLRSIRHIAADGPATAIAATDDGLYQTTDSGQNWIRVSIGTATGVMTSVAVSPFGCVATGAVGLLAGPSCGSLSVVDQPYRGVPNTNPPPLRATVWPTRANVLAGGLGGTLLINRNEGRPAAPPPPPRVLPFSTRSGSGTPPQPVTSQSIRIKPPPARAAAWPRADGRGAAGATSTARLPRPELSDAMPPPLPRQRVQPEPASPAPRR